MSATSDCLIIGAGIAGLMAAQTLQQKGVKPTLLEKSRGVGGRMSTRRHNGAVFDHGAQCFTARSEVFKDIAQRWVQEGVARKWFDPKESERDEAGHPRYRGVPSMTAPAKTLARDLDVRRGERIVKLEREGTGWKVLSAGNTTYTGDKLLITSPVPQACELIDASGLGLPEPDMEWLRSIEYRKTLTVMAILDGPSGLPEEGFIRLAEREPVRLIVDNQIKGISREKPCLTVHSGPEFAERYFEEDEEVWWPLLLNPVFPNLQAKIVETLCHRWRHANPVTSQNDSYYLNEELGLALAGDGFGGPRVEGALYSGILVAEALAKTIHGG